MRFIWFNLMPWPYLPDDFREKYRSVWVDIPSSPTGSSPRGNASSCSKCRHTLAGKASERSVRRPSGEAVA
jgi:hypothetical protein